MAATLIIEKYNGGSVSMSLNKLRAEVCIPSYLSRAEWRDDFPEAPAMSATASEKVLSVSSLNQMAKSLLEGHFSQVTVEGEISNFANPASGHWYFTLKDQKSQLRCAMFAGRNRWSIQPENGDQLIVRGQLSIYPNRGDYQLIVSQMEEAGDGFTACL